MLYIVFTYLQDNGILHSIPRVVSPWRSAWLRQEAANGAYEPRAVFLIKLVLLYKNTVHNKFMIIL